VDGTQLADDSLGWDSHNMGSSLISEVIAVRMAETPRSELPYDRLEFRGTVRGCQPEERQKWISQVLRGSEHQRECRDEDLIERLWMARNARPILLPTWWWPRTSIPLAPPRVGEEMLGFTTEAQGWLPCKQDNGGVHHCPSVPSVFLQC
jgi:hypothetical protein